MQNISLSDHTRDSLIDTLRVLKSYVTASKQIGKRAHLSDPKHPVTPNICIEYSPLSDLAFVKEFSEKVLNRFFPESGELAREFRENIHLSGGIRIFLADDMVDISFDRFSHLMKS